jgi:hypothetical protein
VDGLACPLHLSTVCSHQMRGQDFLSDTALSHRVVVGGGAFSGDANPRAWIFDRGLTAWIPALLNLYMEEIIFIMACSSYVRAIMTFMRVSLVELLRQTVMGRVPTLEYILSGARGLL